MSNLAAILILHLNDFFLIGYFKLKQHRENQSERFKSLAVDRTNSETYIPTWHVSLHVLYYIWLFYERNSLPLLSPILL